MKKWNLLYNLKPKNNNVLDILLENRGLKTKLDINDFLSPDLNSISLGSVGIKKKEMLNTLSRIKTAIKNNEQIIVFGDYDVDGICGTAILWETLSGMGANVMPYIPSRFDEGYGLSRKGIENLLLKFPKVSLIITVDNGIVANDAVNFAKELGIDVIITDHHTSSGNFPNAYSFVYTTSICGAGVAYMLSQQLLKNNNDDNNNNHLELVALATIADLVPLTKANRTFVFYGLKNLQNTKRPGLLSLYDVARIDKSKIDTYVIGHIIAPRLNAMGRLSSAMDSLRLVCTKDKQRADNLSKLLSNTNVQRQELTFEAVESAKDKAKLKLINKLIFIADEDYKEGIIGLIAGRLTEEFYLPSVIISKGEKFSKASARSIKGFNIVEFLREASDLLVDIGGHPMAAGFTVETDKIELLEKRLYELSVKFINKKHLERILNIDMELDFNLINIDTYLEVQKLNPFGMANPEPLFLTKNLKITNVRNIGKDGKHLKINFQFPVSNLQIQGIYFGGVNNEFIKIGENVNAVYSLDMNEWNGDKNLQIKIKDIKNN